MEHKDEERTGPETVDEQEKNRSTGLPDEAEPKKEKQDNAVYVTREGDTLEKLFGVDQIFLAPGMTIYRHK